MYRSPYKCPATITLPFGVPGSYSAGYHTGIDLVGQGDKTLVSVVDGLVVTAVYGNASYGNYIIIQETTTGRSFLYAHLSQILISQWARVSPGQVVGTEGSTGNSTGSHLHLEVTGGDWAYAKGLLNPADYINFNNFGGSYMPKVFINPGHGQKSNGTYDPGAVGPTGYQEATCVKAIGNKLLAKLQGVGIGYYIYQDGDLGDICTESNAWGPDYFVSIHCNASASSTAHGIETYCYAFGGQGEALAKKVQTQLIKLLGRADRGVKEGNFQVLRNTNAPAILAEIGFISNPQEEALMRTNEWQESAAEALAIGICAQLGVPYSSQPVLNGWTGTGNTQRYYDNGTLLKGWFKWDGAWFYADTNGYILFGWQKLSDSYGTLWRYFNPAGDSGRMLEGIQTINGVTYYLTPGVGDPVYKCDRLPADFDPTK